MTNLQTERLSNIEGFLTNSNFPGSQMATPANTPSKPVFESRQLLEQNNVLTKKLATISTLGSQIKSDVAKYKQTASQLLAKVEENLNDADKLKLSNIIVNRLYSKPELDRLVSVIPLGKGRPSADKSQPPPTAVWAFKNTYKEIPSDEMYQIRGALTTNYYGKTPDEIPRMVLNQGKKLTFDECKELVAQLGYIVFGLTNTTIEGGVYKSTCLVPVIGDILAGNLAKWKSVEDNPRQSIVYNVGSNKVSFSIRDGDVGPTPVYMKPQPTQNASDYGFISYINGGNGKKKYFLRLFGQVLIAPSTPTQTSFIAAAAWQLGDPPKRIINNMNLFNYIIPGAGTVPHVAEVIPDSIDGSFRIYWVQPGGSKQYIIKFRPNAGGQAANYSSNPSAAANFTLGPVTDRDADATSLVQKGTYSVENVPPETYVNSRTLSFSAWENIKSGKSVADSSILDQWFDDAMQTANRMNVPYIGFFFKSLSASDGGSGNGQLVAFGTTENKASGSSTFTIKGDNGIVYGDKNTIVYYMTKETLANGKSGFPRLAGKMLGSISYIDEDRTIRPYPTSMLTPKDPSLTQYIMVDKSSSDYFNIPDIPISVLQYSGMSVPACRALCNKYYEKCAAFGFDGSAQTRGMPGVIDGTSMAKCSLKSIDPTIFSWATETNDYSRIYKKIPQIETNWSCSKRSSAVSSSYVSAGQHAMFSDSEYTGIDSDGANIVPFKRGREMNPDEKCGMWRKYDQDAQSMRDAQEKIGQNIAEYAGIIDELKNYNLDLVTRTRINQPMVDIAVKEYNGILTRISDYAATGEYRIDKYKTQMSDTSRKSYIYIYIIWLGIAAIIVYFSTRTLMKLR